MSGQRDTLIDDDLFAGLVDTEGGGPPRAGTSRRTKLVIIATVVCLAVAAVVGAWPSVQHAVRGAIKSAESTSSPEPTPTQTGPSAAATTGPVVSARPTPVSRSAGPRSRSVKIPNTPPLLPVAGPVYQPAPQPVLQPVSQAQPRLRAAPKRQSAPKRQPVPKRIQHPLPPLTWANGETTGPGGVCCSASSGTWKYHAGGGAGGAGFYWTSDTIDKNAQYDWSLGTPSGGLRWDEVRVAVWIPSSLAGANVSYSVTTTYNNSRSVVSRSLTQDLHTGWVSLRGTFKIGTATRRLGSIWVHLNYLNRYINTSDPGCPSGVCNAMAAAQVRFSWS